MADEELNALRTRIAALEAELEQDRREHGFLREALARAPVAIELYDRHGVAAWMNDAMVAFLGFSSPDVAIGKFNVLTDPFARETGLAATFERAYAGEVVRRELLVDLEAAGSKWPSTRGAVWFEELLCPIVGADGGVEAVAAFAVEVTDRKAAQEILVNAQRHESLGALAGGIAHDFNNLLTGVLGNASLLLADGAHSDATRERLETIASAAEHAAGLTSQLLVYAGRGPVHPKPIDVGRLALDLVPLLEVSLPKGVTLALIASDDLPAVTADPTQLRQVLLNLVHNAGQAMAHAEGVVTVRVERVVASREHLARLLGVPHLSPGEYLRVSVEDTGDGIPPELVTRIFEPFFTTRTGGHGLGLASVLGIVRRHGGAVGVSAREPHGSVFEVLLPTGPCTAPVSVRPEPMPRIAASTARILVVDDEPLVRDLVVSTLRLRGHEVLSAQDGEEALSLFHEHAVDIDLLVLDLTMPRMSGRDVLRAVRRLRPELPVLVSSGHGELSFEARSPHTLFLRKPYRAEELDACVSALLVRG